MKQSSGLPLKDLKKSITKESKDPTAQDGDGARLGQEIRKLRKARGCSLEDVANAIGRSVSFCSQLERGGASPSIADLRAVSDLLGVPLGWFFFHDQVPTDEQGKIIRSTTARRRLGTINTGLQEELLSPDIGGAFAMFLSTFGPRAASKGFNIRDTEEEGYVVSGTLELWIGKQHFTVSSGDSFRIVREPYKWENPTDVDVVIVWVISPPTY